MFRQFKALRVDKIILVNVYIGLIVIKVWLLGFVGGVRVEVVVRAKVSLDSIRRDAGCLSLLQRRLLPPSFTVTFLKIGMLRCTQVLVHLRQLLLKRHNC